MIDDSPISQLYPLPRYLLDSAPSGYAGQLKAGYAADRPLAPPLLGVIMLTDLCPSDCVYCPYRTGAFTTSRTFLPTDWTFKIIDVMAEMGIIYIQFSGGEPMLHPDIVDLVAHARQHAMQVNIISSGFVLDQSLAERLVEADLTSLGLSIDALDITSYQANRGKPLWRAQRALQWACYMRTLKPTLWLGVNCVITHNNVGQLMELALELDKLEIASQFQLVNDFSNENENASLVPPLSALQDSIQTLIELRTGGIRVNNSPEYLGLITHYAESRCLPPNFDCYLGHAEIVITPQREVQLCCMLPALTRVDEPESLPEVWGSFEYNQQRRGIHQHACPQCWLLHFDVWK